MNKNWKFVFVVTFFLAFLMVTTQVNAISPSEFKDESLKDVQDSGELVVGTSADYPPYEFIQKDRGKNSYEGIDIEVAKKFAKDIGVKLVIKNMDFDSLLVALETNKVDAIISALSPTPERIKSVDFSKSYYKGRQFFIINKKNKAKYTSLKDFENKIVGAQKGSLQYKLVSEQIEGVNIKGLTRLNDLVIALQTGKVEAVATEEPTAKAFVASNKSLFAFDPGFDLSSTTTGMAIAFHKNSPSLVAKANETITGIVKKNLINKSFIPRVSNKMVEDTEKNDVSRYWNYFVKGIEYTLIITICSIVLGLLLGLIFALLRMSNSKFLHIISVTYIEFIRGTPLMVQVMFIYFGIGVIIQGLPALLSGIIATSLNSGAYVAEIIRSGVMSVNYGQTEASRSLGMDKAQTYRYIVMPQALKNIWPALGNEFITLIKESSIVSIIGVSDLMYQTQLVQAATYKGVFPLFITMMIYFILTFSLTKVLNYFERRMSNG